MTNKSFTVIFLASFLGVQLALGSSPKASPASESRNLATRIVGGTKANPTRFPYYTQVKVYSTDNREGWFCGGTLIARDAVLTAAHCIETGDFYNNITAVDAWVNSTTTAYSEHEHYRAALKLVVHPLFKPYRNDNDIGLIFLDKPVKGVPLVKLNRNASVPVSSNTPSLEVIGLGATGLNESTWSNIFPKHLMRVSIKSMSMLACKKLFGSVIAGESKICAGGNGLKGVCVGDTGGPLIVRKSSASNDVQVGITSNGRYGYRGECIALGEPDIYTRVSYYAKWIDAQRCLYSSKYKPSSCPPS